MAVQGLAGEDDALELGVGEPALGHDPRRQHRTIRERRVRHGGHGARLHQRRRVGDGARNMDGARPPGLVGAGGMRGRLVAVLARVGCGRHGLVGELADRSPVVRRGLRCRRGSPSASGRGGPGRGRMAEQVGARHGLDREPRRHSGGDDLEQVGGIGDAGTGVDLALLLASPVEHGESGVEGGAAARIGAAVYGGGEHRPGPAGRGMRRRPSRPRRRERSGPTKSPPAARRAAASRRRSGCGAGRRRGGCGPRRGSPRRAGSSGPRWDGAPAGSPRWPRRCGG